MLINFLSQVIFVFLLFLGMVMYANEVGTRVKLLEIKVNHNINMSFVQKSDLQF